MKVPIYQRSFRLCLCTIFCFATNAAQAGAQNQQQPSLLQLKACNRELRVSEDGAMVESRRGKITERRLSESQMQKLRRLIARRPCIKEWRQPTSPPPTVAPALVQLSTNYDHGCIADWLSFGLGLDEIKVTMASPDGQVGPFPVYVVCDHANDRNKESAKRSYPRYLKPEWQRFISDVSKAVGSKNFLKGCYCWQD
jgi:hypothetical protein